MLDVSVISIPDWGTFVDILDAVKLARNLPLHMIKEKLKATGSKWSVAADDDKAVYRAIEFSVQLWLMVQPRPELHLVSHLTLEEIVAQSFKNPSTTPFLAMKMSQYDRLSPDFGAKNLVRIGGIDIIWTSFLSEHLLFVGRHQLKVFAHVSLLRKYARSSERNLYPDGLLEETEETIDLLFPTKTSKGSRRTRRLRDKDHVDIEAARDLPPVMTINHYKHWGERLAIVQQVYDAARPRRPRQWWYDRRNRVEWATLAVAVIVFIMTLVFGIISSVTGIMQAYASFKSLK